MTVWLRLQEAEYVMKECWILHFLILSNLLVGKSCFQVSRQKQRSFVMDW